MATKTTPDVIRLDAEELASVIEELEPIANAITGFGELLDAKVKVRFDGVDLLFTHDGTSWFIEVPLP